MNIKETILKNYYIDEIIDIHEPLSGSGNAFIITTPAAKFIAKRNEREDFISIYNKVQLKLSKQNIIQSKIIKTKLGNISTPEGLVIYEYIHGDNYKSLNETQIQNTIIYLASYNKALQRVSFNKNELIEKNYWDWAKSLDFIINKLPTIINSSTLEETSRKIIIKAVNILNENEKKLNNLPKQLIHADLGADNFIFDKNNVKSIIDFTPEYSHEYYALCHFVYWNYLYNNKDFNRGHIENILRIYNDGECKEESVVLFRLLLIKASLFRVVGPFLNIYYSDKTNYSKLTKRINILKSVIF